MRIWISFPRYINALEADGKFAKNVSRTMLRSHLELVDTLHSKKNRTSDGMLLNIGKILIKKKRIIDNKFSCEYRYYRTVK